MLKRNFITYLKYSYRYGEAEEEADKAKGMERVEATG